jgi:hypothetical protein
VPILEILTLATLKGAAGAVGSAVAKEGLSSLTQIKPDAFWGLVPVASWSVNRRLDKLAKNSPFAVWYESDGRQHIGNAIAADISKKQTKDHISWLILTGYDNCYAVPFDILLQLAELYTLAMVENNGNLSSGDKIMLSIAARETIEKRASQISVPTPELIGIANGKRLWWIGVYGWFDRHGISCIVAETPASLSEKERPNKEWLDNLSQMQKFAGQWSNDLFASRRQYSQDQSQALREEVAKSRQRVSNFT